MTGLIFGYTWDEIQAMQNKTYKPKIIMGDSKPIPLTESELNLYREIGIAGLEARGFYGIIDRIKRLNIMEDEK